jgi:hypothetical protein
MNLRALVVLPSIFLAAAAAADHHEMPRAYAEVYDCQLNDGHSLSEVASFAREAFSPWVKKQGLEGNTFLWEPVAVAAPFDEADFRWVNYHPSWTAYAKGAEAWRSASAAKLREELFSLVSCKLPAFATVFVTDPSEEAPSEKMVMLGKCQFKPDSELDLEGLVAAVKNQNRDSRTDGDLLEAVWLTNVGIENEPWDFLRMTAGSGAAIGEMMDRSMGGGGRLAPNANPFKCEVDFHRSHATR